MQSVHPTNDIITKYGGRIASDALRASRSFAEGFAGLDEGADRYGLLLLVKRAGKLAGFTPRMTQLLDYYIAYTRDIDWEAGGQPVVYTSLSRTALDLGVSERQVQKLEAALFAAGAITWNDSGNHKRYGRRCPDTGRIVFAYGVDLTPLAYLREEMAAKLDAKRRHDDAWLAAKRAISALRREFRGLVAECAERDGHGAVCEFVGRYDAIAIQIRTHLSLERVETLVAAHRSLVSELRDAMGITTADGEHRTQHANLPKETCEGSSRSEQEFAHYKYTTLPTKVSCSPGGGATRGSVAEGPSPNRPTPSTWGPTAMQYVTLAMALGAASDALAARLPSDAGWNDLVEAAYLRRRDLGVSQESWGEACRVLGRSGAAVALLVTDRASLREVDPVWTPPAYFRGMVRRAEAGELRLCRSLFGLLERDRTAKTCAA